MAEKNVLFPSLSEDGWLTSTILKADALFSHFLVSDYSQTYLYNDKVTSFTWILQNNQGNIGKLLTDLRSALEIYFARYFENITVETTEIPNTEEPSKAKISIFVSFTDYEDKQYSLGKILEISDLKVTNIININNG